MRYFLPQEFRGWYSRMDSRLLALLDDFRDDLGEPVIVSPAPGAIGRHLGLKSKSWHNIDWRGAVRAIDIMIPGIKTMSYGVAQDLIGLAQHVGFGGVGVYPDWHPLPGLHLDVRPQRHGIATTWARRHDGKYMSVEEAFGVE